MNRYIVKTRDKIVERVIQSLDKRSVAGINKYGTTLDENKTDDFLKHLQEELLDAANYIEKLKQDKKGGEKPVSKMDEVLMLLSDVGRLKKLDYPIVQFHKDYSGKVMHGLYKKEEILFIFMGLDELISKLKEELK